MIYYPGMTIHEYEAWQNSFLFPMLSHVEEILDTTVEGLGVSLPYISKEWLSLARALSDYVHNVLHNDYGWTFAESQFGYLIDMLNRTVPVKTTEGWPLVMDEWYTDKEHYLWCVAHHPGEKVKVLCRPTDDFRRMEVVDWSAVNIQPETSR